MAKLRKPRLCRSNTGAMLWLRCIVGVGRWLNILGKPALQRAFVFIEYVLLAVVYVVPSSIADATYVGMFDVMDISA